MGDHYWTLPEAEGRPLRTIDLRGTFGDNLARFPWLMRVIAENRLRSALDADPAEILPTFRDWFATGRSEVEVPFLPRRVLMHDTTCGPAPSGSTWRVNSSATPSATD